MQLSTWSLFLSCQIIIWRMNFADEITLTRLTDGDIFTTPGSCFEACMFLSSNTASPYTSDPTPAVDASITYDSCTCQCNNGLPIFREDLRICVDHINGKFILY
uniref:Shavenoid isoform B-like N-terminal domain-containing protein n=1 Tax=Trichogramma kaykai TaxID=54128 RepID=A0ABD2WAV0_9HYME